MPRRCLCYAPVALRRRPFFELAAPLRWAASAVVASFVSLATLGSAGAAPEDEEEPPPPLASEPRPAAPREHVQRVAYEPSDEPPTLGPRDAPVRVELFFQPGVANSRMPYQLVSELWRNHPTRIRVIFRVLSRQGQVHLPATALEAAAQGKFFELMNAVHTRLRGPQKELIRALADSVGIDLDRLDNAWDTARYAEVFEVNERRRTRMRARQIPDVLFSGKIGSRPVTVMSATDLEASYREAYARALDALDRGVTREQLADYLDANALADRPPLVLSLGPADERPEEDDGRAEASMALLSPPADLRGLPTRWTPSGSSEDPGVPAAREPAPRGLPVLLACNPLSAQCYRHLHLVEAAADVFENRVRVVWAPMFELRSRDAATVARVADAVLCAHQLGIGWSALDAVLLQANRRHGRILDANRLIDDLIGESDLDSAALASCLAVNAGAAVRRVQELRRSGMNVSPTLVVGGRMYPGIVSDASSLQALIEEELMAGWLGRATLDASLGARRDADDNASIISPTDRSAAPVSRR
jgi:hypothetical protein